MKRDQQEIEPGESSLLANRNLRALIVVAIYQGFTVAINPVAAPWIMPSFGIGPAGLAGLFAWIATSALLAFGAMRLFDRIGRRRVVWWTMAMTPLGALGAALSATIVAFTMSEIVLNAAASAAVGGIIVLIAEELPVHQRAKGQSLVGLALGAGTGCCLMAMPALVRLGLSWRWLLLAPAVPVLCLGPVWRMLTAGEFRSDHAPANHGDQVPHRVLSRRYRRRAGALGLALAARTTATATAASWSYFHCTRVAGMSPLSASLTLLIAGSLANLGYALGATFSDRFGRVPTVAAGSSLMAVSTAWSFWGPPNQFRAPALWLGVGFFAISLARNATNVGVSSSATELFPASLRGTIIGWLGLIQAAGSIAAQSLVARFAPMAGGVSPVVGGLGLLALITAAIFAFAIEETRGIDLNLAYGPPDRADLPQL